MKVDFRKNYKGFYEKSGTIGILVSTTRNKGHKEYNPQYICNYCGQKARRMSDTQSYDGWVECREEECRTIASMTSHDVWLPPAYFNLHPTNYTQFFFRTIN